MYILKLIFRNTFRHKLRTLLTILGVTIAILTFTILRTLVNAWYAGVEASSPARLITRNSISLTFHLPIAYKERISRTPGVKSVSYATWFSGIYISEKNFIPNFAIDPETFLGLYPEYLLPEDQKNAFLRDRTAAVAGRKVAERFNWKVGDTVPLTGTIYPGTWNFILRGIYDGAELDTDETQLFFHWEYLNEQLKKTASHRADHVGIYIIGITNPALASEVSEAIDNMFQNSLAETMTETEKSFQLGFIAMTEAIVVVIQLISFMVILIIMAVVANTMVMTERERIGEYAIMKALGFGGRHLAIIIFGESLVITMAGCIAGIALAFPAAGIFRELIGMYFPVFTISTLTILVDIATSIMVAMIAALFPASRAIQIRVAEGLRRIG
ncbi:MAG: ABC transporter permease [Candidatus Loosdrechtia sp.]|uniref:ABC transporter permease n=1 Tax=Candidatus Loosdrechtia sp. TaxID=3101272 RepID=UPI003A72F02A|nr:MAG: FtsX-like permease family protein [Candidatus Jettenia sp. AMX2]